jgi:hypothetical protein
LEDLPDLDAIVNGESVSIPDAIDLQYAICSALVGRAISVKDKDNAQQVWGNILNFARDFPQKELGVMLVSDMQRAIGEEIFAIPEFANWVYFSCVGTISSPTTLTGSGLMVLSFHVGYQH